MHAAMKPQAWIWILTLVSLAWPLDHCRADTQTIQRRLLQSTGWINCSQPNGGNSWGTCWVFDRQKRLVITNRHVVNDADAVFVDFPHFRDRTLLTLVADYVKLTPIRGKVLAFDDKRDLAVCQLEQLPDEITAIPLARDAARRGNKVFSLGNSSANTPKKDDARLWRFVHGKVEMRYFDTLTFKKPAQKVEATSIRTSLKTAPGDSGGAVVNTWGEVVAVHSNADNFNSFGIDVNEVRVFMDRATAVRRLPPSLREVTGTWTVATTDELGRCYWSLTVRGNGNCVFERDERHEGTFWAERSDKVRLSIPGLQMRGEVTLRWANDEQFSFTLNGLEYTATRR